MRYVCNPIVPLYEVQEKSKRYKKGVATRVARNDRYVTVRYHNTDIITIDFENRTVTLDAGNYYTVTTKRRMNQVMKDFDIPYRVHQHKYKWYVYNIYTQENYEFYNGIELPF